MHTGWRKEHGISCLIYNINGLEQKWTIPLRSVLYAHFYQIST